MTVVAFFMDLVLGMCLHPIARWLDYLVDVRRRRCD